MGVDATCPHEGGSERVRFLRDPEGWIGHAASADLVLFQHVLEHMEDPVAFLHRLSGAMVGGKGLVYREVPNAKHLVESLFVWDVIYEHPFYFTPLALSRVFETSRFEVRDVKELFELQFLGLMGRPSSSPEPSEGGEVAAEGLSLERVERFGRLSRRGASSWRSRLQACGETEEGIAL